MNLLRIDRIVEYYIALFAKILPNFLEIFVILNFLDKFIYKLIRIFLQENTVLKLYKLSIGQILFEKLKFEYPFEFCQKKSEMMLIMSCYEIAGK